MAVLTYIELKNSDFWKNEIFKFPKLYNKTIESDGNY